MMGTAFVESVKQHRLLREPISQGLATQLALVTTIAFTVCALCLQNGHNGQPAAMLCERYFEHMWFKRPTVPRVKREIISAS